MKDAILDILNYDCYNLYYNTLLFERRLSCVFRGLAEHEAHRGCHTLVMSAIFVTPHNDAANSMEISGGSEEFREVNSFASEFESQQGKVPLSASKLCMASETHRRVDICSGGSQRMRIIALATYGVTQEEWLVLYRIVYLLRRMRVSCCYWSWVVKSRDNFAGSNWNDFTTLRNVPAM